MADGNSMGRVQVPHGGIPQCVTCTLALQAHTKPAAHECPLDAWLRREGMPVAAERDIAAMEARLSREHRIERLRASGIKPVLRAEDRKRVVDGPLLDTHALERTRLWMAQAMRTKDPDRNILVLAGNPGTGKTLAAGWAIAAAGGRYATTEEYLRAYSRWHRDVMQADLSSRELDRYEGNGLVVLDEIGTERDAALMRDALHRLVDRRQSRRKQTTIMITNLTRDAFIERLKSGVYDPRTLDRMRRDAVVVGVRDESLRDGEVAK